eukprot:3562061-Amphidinium_carterae.1
MKRFCDISYAQLLSVDDESIDPKSQSWQAEIELLSTWNFEAASYEQTWSASSCMQHEVHDEEPRMIKVLKTVTWFRTQCWSAAPTVSDAANCCVLCQGVHVYRTPIRDLVEGCAGSTWEKSIARRGQKQAKVNKTCLSRTTHNQLITSKARQSLQASLTFRDAPAVTIQWTKTRYMNKNEWEAS